MCIFSLVLYDASEIIFSEYINMDFQTFITKYSFINSQFVKDFYNIIKEDYIERYNEFLIDS
jgi:hypothetical protein